MVARVIDHPFSAGVIPTPYNPDPALLAIVEIIRDGLIRDQHVRLYQFGTFRLRWSKERQIKHPKTGALITVAPVPKVTFTPAKNLREFIDPDRKAPVPLNSSEIPNTTTNKTRATIKENGPSSNPDQHPADKATRDQSTLTETVQDIIDENYNIPVADPNDFRYRVETGNAKPGKKETVDPKKKWMLGLLAAVPLILMILQADFRPENNTSSHQRISAETDTLVDSPTTTQLPENPGTIPRNNKKQISNEHARNDTNGIRTDKAAIIGRNEPSSKPYFMKPQIHTIGSGENLWKLAERYYGDALLWPHIYRANLRTVSDPDKIITGKQLVIPGLQQSPKQLSRQDKARIAEGYYEVYQFNRAKQSTQAIYFLIGASQFSQEWLFTVKPDIPKNDWKTVTPHFIK